MPVVSERPTSSAPAAATCAASQTTSSAGTSPCSVQPNAVEIPTSTPTCDARASRSSTMARTSSTICSRVLRTLASECAALADTGIVILCTPASMAASAPFRFGTSAITVHPGSATACRTTSAASAICGSSFAGTNDATSISRRPAACSPSIQRELGRSRHRPRDALQSVARADFADQHVGDHRCAVSPQRRRHLAVRSTVPRRCRCDCACSSRK